MQALDYRVKDVLDGLRERTGCDLAALAEIDRRERQTRWTQASGNRNDRYASIVVRHGQGIEGEVVKIGRGIAWDNENAPKLAGCSILLTERLLSAYATPVSAGGETVGIVLAGDRTRQCYGLEKRAEVLRAAEAIAEWMAQREKSDPEEDGLR